MFLKKLYQSKVCEIELNANNFTDNTGEDGIYLAADEFYNCFP